MKVALVHDYLSEFGGAERVLQALGEIYPKSPIYTAFVVKGSTAWKKFKEHQIIEWQYAWLIKQKKLYSPLRFLAPLIWHSFDFSQYDLVISSASWYITKGINTLPETFHLCYCHTPPRYLYGYQTAIEWQRYWPIKVYALIVNNFLRRYDFKSSQKVDQFIANSENVRLRIKKFYRREAKVIYPPVEVEAIKKACKNLKPKNYFLIVSRVVGAKGIDLAIKAANQLNFNLKIVGEPAGLRWEEKKFRQIQGKRVEFLGRVEDNKLWKLYGECKAFLALAKDEDFGITPVEAMASGRPVIAYKGGGYLETVINGKTGLFIDELNIKEISLAIKKFHTTIYRSEDCIKQAEKFSKERFKREIKDFVASSFKKWQNR